MHYLTVQDILWINLQVTKRTQSFNYAKLEEATFYQYAYGSSGSLVSQAARFLSGFANKKPFAAGNEATGFIGCLTFLKLNGMNVNLSDDAAGSWLERATKDATTATEMLSDVVKPDETFDEHHDPSVRDAVLDVLDAYPKTISLTGRQMHAALV